MHGFIDDSSDPEKRRRVEDAMQDAYIQAYKTLRSSRPLKPATWLTRIAVNRRLRLLSADHFVFR
jgi:DNA-directed RNA polymerase specialized sigma24 family protein